MSNKDARKQVNVRIDADLEGMIDDLRGQQRPIPTLSQLLRQALVEKAERDLKRVTRR